MEQDRLQDASVELEHVGAIIEAPLDLVEAGALHRLARRGAGAVERGLGPGHRVGDRHQARGGVAAHAARRELEVAHREHRRLLVGQARVARSQSADGLLERRDVRGGPLELAVERQHRGGRRGVVAAHERGDQRVHVERRVPQQVREHVVIERPGAPQPARRVHVVEVPSAQPVVGHEVAGHDVREQKRQRLVPADVVVLADQERHRGRAVGRRTRT